MTCRHARGGAKPRPLYLRERSPVPIIEMLRGPQSRSRRVWKENSKSLTPSGVRKPDLPARNVAVMSTTLFHPRSQNTENETCVSADIRMSLASIQGRCGEKMQGNRLNYGTAGCSTSSGRKTKTLYSPRPSRVLFAKPPLMQTENSRMSEWTMSKYGENVEGYRSWPNLIYCLDILLEGLITTTENFSHDRRCLGWDLNPAYPKR
jgi:hypothetical protein